MLAWQGKAGRSSVHSSYTATHANALHLAVLTHRRLQFLWEPPLAVIERTGKGCVGKCQDPPRGVPYDPAGYPQSPGCTGLGCQGWGAWQTPAGCVGAWCPGPPYDTYYSEDGVWEHTLNGSKFHSKQERIRRSSRRYHYENGTKEERIARLLVVSLDTSHPIATFQHEREMQEEWLADAKASLLRLLHRNGSMELDDRDMLAIHTFASTGKASTWGPRVLIPEHRASALAFVEAVQLAPESACGWNLHDAYIEGIKTLSEPLWLMMPTIWHGAAYPTDLVRERLCT